MFIIQENMYLLTNKIKEGQRDPFIFCHESSTNLLWLMNVKEKEGR